MELLSPKLIAKATGNRPKSTERRWIIWTNPCIFRGDLPVSGRVLTMDTLGWLPGWYEFKIRDLQTIYWMVRLCLSFVGLSLIQRDHIQRGFLPKQNHTAYVSTKMLICIHFLQGDSTARFNVKRFSSFILIIFVLKLLQNKKPWLGLNFRTTCSMDNV